MRISKVYLSRSGVFSLIWPIHPIHHLSECNSPLLSKAVLWVCRCILNNMLILLIHDTIQPLGDGLRANGKCEAVVNVMQDYVKGMW